MIELAKTIALSVIVTTYNSSEYIEDCLESLERQLLANIEVIIVNDGSKDDSERKVFPFLSRNKHWRYISHDNRGVGFTRNRAILLARGRYVAFLDSDDYVEDWMYADLIDIAMKEESCVVLSNFRKWNEETGETITERKDRYDELHCLDRMGVLSYVYGGKIFGMACASIFRRSLFFEVKTLFPVNTYHEDIFVMPRLYASARKISHSKRAGYVWRMRGNSESHSINSRHVTSVLHALLEAQDYLKSEGVYRELKRVFTTHCIMYLNGLRKRIIGLPISVPSKGYLEDLLLSASHKILSDKVDYVDLHKRSYGDFVDFIRGHLNDAKPIVNAVIVKPVRATHVDVAFFPHKKYHTITMLPVARELTRMGMSVAFIDMSDDYGNEAAFEDFDSSEFFFFKFSSVQDGLLSYQSSVFMNDWDTKCAAPTIRKDNSLGRSTFGIVEGIQDFWDRDTGRHRNSYQNVSHLIAAGDHDLKYFAPGTHKKVYVGGVPRITPLLERPIIMPKEPIALINVNFTYGVLETERTSFIEAATSAAKKAGFRPVISRHPQDKGDLSEYEVVEHDMYTAIDRCSVFISRFSSGIIESIAMGKPAIYFNPKIEDVDKFVDPIGSFRKCSDDQELFTALSEIRALVLSGDAINSFIGVREKAEAFLSKHCGVGVKGASPLGIAKFIFDNTRRLCQATASNESYHQLRQTNHGPYTVSFLVNLSSKLLVDPDRALSDLKDDFFVEKFNSAIEDPQVSDRLRNHFKAVHARARNADISELVPDIDKSRIG